VFTIGDFSRITGLTVTTLRFYHEQGLLAPSYVDHETGYRYYDRSKIETARIILHKGPYNQLGRSYAKILDYIRGQGYDVLSPTREIYHKGPGMFFRGNAKNYLTEIQMLIAGDATTLPAAS
jgi:DNA-binding transcriptional MerR regulator